MPMTANGLAKLLEELGELAQVAAKRLAYFHTSAHPDGAGDLNERMQHEMGDVLAACDFVAARFGLDKDAIESRKFNKRCLFEKWHADPDNGKDCFHAGQAGTLDTEAAMLERIAAAVPAPHDTALCSVARRLRAVGVIASDGTKP
jgi:NTP pyrophosphatase (non-canonical NTP hydrolase)